MTVTYPLNMPTNRVPARIRLTSKNASATSSSPYTFKTQVFVYPGQMWSAQVELPVMKRDDASLWIAFLLSLRGRQGTFYMGDPDAVLPLGSARTTPGSPAVNGLQTGSEISVRGLPVSVVGYLLPSDYVQIGTGPTATLHRVLEQVDTTAGGTAVLSIWPAARRDLSDGLPVVVSSTKGLFRLSSNQQDFDLGSASRYGMSFECEEVV